MKQKSTLILLLLIFFSSAAHVQAQRKHNPKFRHSTNFSFRHEPKLSFFVGTGLSIMNSDNPSGMSFSTEPIKKNGFGPTVNVGTLYNVTPYIGILGNLEYARFRGYEGDADLNTFSFRSEGISASGSVVINLLSNYAGTGIYRSKRRRLIVPYVKAGIGIMHYKASSFKEGRGDIAYEEFESQTKYPATAAVVPVGGGFKIYYTKRISFVPEFNLNFITTDYLDNMKEDKGVLGRNDHFANFSFKVLYTPSKKM